MAIKIKRVSFDKTFKIMYLTLSLYNQESHQTCNFTNSKLYVICYSRLSAECWLTLFTWVEHWVRVTLRTFSLRIELATSEVKGEWSDHCATEAFNVFLYLVYLLKYFDWKQWHVRHFGLVSFYLINGGFNDVKRRVSLLKALPSGQMVISRYLKCCQSACYFKKWPKYNYRLMMTDAHLSKVFTHWSEK